VRFVPSPDWALSTSTAYTYPIATGTGSSLFANLQALQPLRLVSNTPFPSGFVELVYDRPSD
jgi:hypothetical protein